MCVGGWVGGRVVGVAIVLIHVSGLQGSAVWAVVLFPFVLVAYAYSKAFDEEQLPLLKTM